MKKELNLGDKKEMQNKTELVLENIGKGKEENTIFSGLNLTVSSGMVLGLVGKNGSGKSALLKLIAGIMKPDEGTIFLNGMTYQKCPERMYQQIGYVPDRLGNYDDMSVKEFMMYFAAAYGMTGLNANTKTDELLKLFGLNDRKTEKINNLSAGMQVRLLLSRALLPDPKVLLVDQIFYGLDEEYRNRFRRMLVKMAEEGKIVVISSNIYTEIERICTHAAFLSDGKIEQVEKIENILQKMEQDNPLVIQAISEQDVKKTVSLLRPLSFVHSITVNGDKILVKLQGTDGQEEILNLLLKENIPVLHFGRKKADLESYIRQRKEKEKNEKKSSLFA